MVQMALEMDNNVTEEMSNDLQKENAFFDATHTHMYGFKSLGLWIKHPAMGETLHLASMEIWSENTKDIVNKLCSEFKGEEGYKFNPEYFICDNGSANHKAICVVYSKAFVQNWVKGCIWHFKHDVISHLSKIQEELDKDKFVTLTDELCNVSTIDDYTISMKKLLFWERSILH